jgi:hypothetical protein
MSVDANKAITLTDPGQGRVPLNEFYKKGCQEKSSASTGEEILFSTSSPLL